MKQAIAEVGGDPADLQVQGTALLRRDSDGGIDVDASISPVADVVACRRHGNTFHWPAPETGQRGRAVLAAR